MCAVHAATQGVSPDRIPRQSASGRPLQPLAYLRLDDSGAKTFPVPTVVASSSDAAAAPPQGQGLEHRIAQLAGDGFDAFIRARIRAPIDEDAHAWWHTIGSADYRFVEPIARKYFSILGSTAAVERVFSNAKFWCRQERARIGDDLLEIVTMLSMLMCRADFDASLIFRDNPYSSTL